MAIGLQHTGAIAAGAMKGAEQPLDDATFERLRQLIYDRFGIHLTAEKKTLVAGRLSKPLRQRGLTFSEYVHRLAGAAGGPELDRLINAISTNYSYFYREEKHFSYFSRVVLPEISSQLRQEGKQDLRLWSAGCSTGEEPYTLALLLSDFFGTESLQWDAGVLATDISSRVLEIARQGVYEKERVTRLPVHLRQAGFIDRGEGMLQVVDAVRQEVTYRRFNLMNRQFPFKKQFHVIFCRNVMIYFDQPTREALLERFLRALAPGGYLFIGHSESLGRDRSGFRFVIPACYQKSVL